MKKNLNPLFENFFGHSTKFKVQQDYYLNQYLNRYKLESLNIIDNSETIQDAYNAFNDLTEITLLNLDSCSNKARNDGFISYNTYKLKCDYILKNMNLLTELLKQNDPNWKIKMISAIKTESLFFKFM